MVTDLDFTALKNVKINPQTVWTKSLFHTVLNGVTITGSFDDVEVRGTDFTGAKSVDGEMIKINPQTLKAKSVANAKLSGIEFIGSFYDVYVCGADFTGSKGAVINPPQLFEANMTNADLRDTIVVDDFDGIIMDGAIIDDSLIIDKDEVIEEKEKEYSIAKIKSILNK